MFPCTSRTVHTLEDCLTEDCLVTPGGWSAYQVKGWSLWNIFEGFDQKIFFGRKILAIIFWVGWFMACKFGIRCGSRMVLGFCLKPKWFYVLFFYFFFRGGRLVFAPIRKSLLLDNRSKRPGGKTSKRGFLSEKKVSWSIKTSQPRTPLKRRTLQNIRHLGFQISNFVQVWFPKSGKS